VKLSPCAILPRFHCHHRLALNLYSAYAVHISPKTRKPIKTDLQINLLPGTIAFIRPKTDLALHYFISTVSTVINHTFKGNLAITIINNSDTSFFIKPGDCIGFLLVVNLKPLTTT